MEGLVKILPNPVCPVDGTPTKSVGLQLGKDYTLMMLPGRWCPGCKGYVVGSDIIRDPKEAAQKYCAFSQGATRKLKEEGFQFNL